MNAFALPRGDNVPKLGAGLAKSCVVHDLGTGRRHLLSAVKRKYAYGTRISRRSRGVRRFRLRICDQIVVARLCEQGELFDGRAEG